MPAWINITIDDLRETKVSALVDAYQDAALGEDQSDPLPGIIENVCTRIRAEIRSGGKISVSETANAIPPSLKSLALRLVVWEAQSRINVFNSVPMTDQDNTDHRDDLDYLKRIADGYFIEYAQAESIGCHAVLGLNLDARTPPERELMLFASDGVVVCHRFDV